MIDGCCRGMVQAKSEKGERKAIAIPSIVESVKAAAPQKLDYGLDYFRECCTRLFLQLCSDGCD